MIDIQDAIVESLRTASRERQFLVSELSRISEHLERVRVSAGTLAQEAEGELSRASEKTASLRAMLNGEG